MKTNKPFVAIILILVVLFLSQFAAELFSLLNPVPKTETQNKKPLFDFRFFSLSSQIYTESAFAWLEVGAGDSGVLAIKKSIPLLLNSLRRNPLDYKAHYYLAKAYLQFSAVNNDYFELGVRELKRAASIHGRNKQIALDCTRVFFSLWPLLDDDDKNFASDLIAYAMPILSWAEFTPLVELWSFYVQDTHLLMELLKRKPDFFGPAADQLVAVKLPIEQRHELLNMYEIHISDVLERRFNELNLQGHVPFNEACTMFEYTHKIKGYYRLWPKSQFSNEKFEKLQRFLYLEVIAGLLNGKKPQVDHWSNPQVNELVQTYIQNYFALNALDELEKVLVENNFYKNNDFPSLRLKTLISYKKGSYNDIISEIESLRKTISYVKKEQSADYTDILLILVDSYFNSKLMTAAESVAQELYQNQPENPDVLYRVLRVQKILGAEGAPDKVLNEKLAAIENSRFLTVTKASSSFDVFLLNQPEIEIVFDPVLRAKFENAKLLQVFVDGKIAFECYADNVPEKIIVGKQFTDIERKVRVQVNIL